MIRELFEKGHIEYISGEEWKAFGSYLVSSFGRIYSMHKNRMLKPVYCRSTGYLMIDLSERGEVERYCVHRLVAMLHVPNPERKAVVHHKDCDKLNNRADNLQWLTYLEHYETHERLKGNEVNSVEYKRTDRQ